MRFRLLATPVLVVALGLYAACGGKTLDDTRGNGDAGSGDSSSGATGGASGGSGGSSARGGTGGSESGGPGKGGTSAGKGGDGTGGASLGGTGAGGGSEVGGASGVGGSLGGAGAGLGGSAGGTGGSAAGAGGSVAGAGGCGVCLRVACLPSVMLSVTAPENIVDLEAELTNDTLGTDTTPLSCYASGGAPCSWQCTASAFGLPNGDYSIAVTAPGYAKKTVEFTLQAPTNCGCCGCGCGPSYNGSVELAPSSTLPSPECCAALDTDLNNCGSCGHACQTGEACNSGVCGAPCLSQGSSCGNGGPACCGGLTCCSGAADAPHSCYAACPP